MTFLNLAYIFIVRLAAVAMSLVLIIFCTLMVIDYSEQLALRYKKRSGLGVVSRRTA